MMVCPGGDGVNRTAMKTASTSWPPISLQVIWGMVSGELALLPTGGHRVAVRKLMLPQGLSGGSCGSSPP